MTDLTNNEIEGIAEPVSTVGAKLQRAREKKKLTIAEVAAQLRLTKDMVNYLETDQWDKMHGRTYARGYFSSYVSFLSLPEDEFLTDFNLEYSSTDSAPKLSQNSGEKKKLPWLKIVLLIMISIGLAGLAYYQWQQTQTEPDLPSDEQVSDSSQQESDTFGSSVVEPISEPELDVLPENEVIFEAGPETELQLEQEAEQSQDVVLSDVTATEEMSGSDIDDQQAVKAEGEINPVDNVDNTPVNQLSTLALQVLKDCWVDVRDADGKVLINQTITGDTDISIEGKAPLKVVLGRATDVIVTFNGEVFDTSSYALGGVARFNLGIESE